MVVTSLKFTNSANGSSLLICSESLLSSLLKNASKVCVSILEVDCLSELRILILNDFFDVYSKAPVTKFEILDFCKKVYGLEYSIQKSEVATGITKSYYSTNTKALSLGYTPAFTSLEGIQTEMEKMLNKK